MPSLPHTVGASTNPLNIKRGPTRTSEVKMRCQVDPRALNPRPPLCPTSDQWQPRYHKAAAGHRDNSDAAESSRRQGRAAAKHAAKGPQASERVRRCAATPAQPRAPALPRCRATAPAHLGALAPQHRPLLSDPRGAGVGRGLFEAPASPGRPTHIRKIFHQKMRCKKMQINAFATPVKMVHVTQICTWIATTKRN